MPLNARQQRFVAEYAIDLDRFWSKVDKSGDCWVWTGATDERGYGRFHIGVSRNATALAHRLAFGIETGESPEAVCHHCDNPMCVRAEHLFAGTRADNNRDMVAKGRYRGGNREAGERNHRAKLTNAQASAIRDEYAGGGSTQRAIAARYGVSQRTITKIANGISYAA